MQGMPKTIRMHVPGNCLSDAASLTWADQDAGVLVFRLSRSYRHTMQWRRLTYCLSHALHTPAMRL
jgi:hypothetical protein